MDSEKTTILDQQKPTKKIVEIPLSTTDAKDTAHTTSQDESDESKEKQTAILNEIESEEKKERPKQEAGAEKKEKTDAKIEKTGSTSKKESNKPSIFTAMKNFISDRTLTDFTPFDQRFLEAVNTFNLPTGIHADKINALLRNRGFTLDQLRELHGITNPCTKGEIAVGSFKLSILHPLKIERIQDLEDASYETVITPLQRVWDWDFTPFGEGGRIMDQTPGSDGINPSIVPNREY